MQPPKQRVNVTLDQALIDRLKALAKHERRSFSAQIQLLLERQLDAEQT